MIYIDLIFLCFVGIHTPAFSIFPGECSFGKTSGQTKRANGSDILLQVLYYWVMSWYIIQEIQVGFRSGGGGITHYRLYSLVLIK